MPPYVAWWVPSDQHQLDWQQGADRLDHLHAHGSTAFAFDFRKPFDAAGNPCVLDHVAMQAKGKTNAAGGGTSG